MGRYEGICALTGHYGKFIKCHILPRSVTYSSNSKKRGNPEAQFIEISGSSHPKLAHTSWYDPSLVGQTGEDLLSRIDTWGYDILMKYGLLGPATPIANDLSLDFAFQDGEVDRLRRFVLSILWRAAVSKMPQFGEVVLEAESIEILKRYVLEEITLGTDDFPISFQRVMGLSHQFNSAPICDEHILTNNFTNKKFATPRFTFYFNGLNVFVGTRTTDSILHRTLGNCALVAGNGIVVECVTYESGLKDLLLQKMTMTEHRYPDQIKRMVQ